MGSLKQRFHGPIAVCLELSKRPLVYALQKYDYLKYRRRRPGRCPGHGPKQVTRPVYSWCMTPETSTIVKENRQLSIERPKFSGLGVHDVKHAAGDAEVPPV